MTISENTPTRPKIEIQYSGEDSFEANKVILEFSKDRSIFLIEYDDVSNKLIARFMSHDPKVGENIQSSEHWTLEREDIQSGNIRFKVVIGQSLWRFQRIKKQIEVTEIRGIIRKLSTDQIVYEYAGRLAELSKIEIINLPL